MSAAVAIPAAADTHFAELAEVTGLTAAQWRDVLTCSAADQAMIVDGWKQIGAISWAKEPDRLAQVLAILGTLGAILGFVTGVGNAVGGVAGALSILKNL